MATLNSFQKITRCLPGQPFGSGAAGDATISADPATRATLTTVAAGQTVITIGTDIFTNGDVFALYQARGTGVGQWEINRVSSGGGSTSITCQAALNYSYASSGASVAQVIKIPQYGIVTLSNFTVGAWDGTKGGITFVCAKTSIGGTGTLLFNGGNGANSAGGDNQTVAGGTGGGFRGGLARNDMQSTTRSNAAEGTVGAEVAYQTAANGSGGGAGGATGGDQGGGGGGGNGTAGANGTKNGTGTVGIGGGTSGSADLITMTFGGGGGGGWVQESAQTSSGAAGGAILVLISNSIDISGMTLVNLNGGNGAAVAGGGGGGAGGSCLLVCGNAVLGTNKITATGGAGGDGSLADGGVGGVGHIAIHHSGAVIGTTSPTFTDVEDLTLIETNAAILYGMV